VKRSADGVSVVPRDAGSSPLRHTYEWQQHGDAYGCYDQGFWDRISWADVLTSVDEGSFSVSIEVKAMRQSLTTVLDKAIAAMQPPEDAKKQVVSADTEPPAPSKEKQGAAQGGKRTLGKGARK
jgi:hypothetical protein